MEEKPLLLVGYFGFGNLGDEETLRIFTARLYARGIPYRVLCRSGEKTGERSVSRWNPFSLKAAIRGASAMVAVGGNLLQSESSVRSLLYYNALFSYAAKAGIPLFLYGGGIGAFRPGRSGEIVKHLLPRFSSLGMRTGGDLSAAKALVADKKTCRFTPDLCFSLPERQGKKEDLLLLIPRKKSVGDAWLGKLILSAAAAGWKTVIALFHPKEDGAALARLAAAYGCASVIPRSYEDFSRVCRAARVTVSERFHGGVFSLLCHTPCYLHAEREKCRRLCDTAGVLAPAESLLCPFYDYRELTESPAGIFFPEKAQGTDKGALCAAEEVGAGGNLFLRGQKETGDKISGFSRVISLLRHAEEESFTEWLRFLEEGKLTPRAQSRSRQLLPPQG